jgi:hypothetical protein
MADTPEVEGIDAERVEIDDDAGLARRSGMTPDGLWKILQRLDGYVNTTNARAPLVMTFNTFVVGGTVLQWRTIVQEFTEASWAVTVASILLVVIGGAALVSLALVFRIIAPSHAGGSGSATPQSLIFFEEIARHASADAYATRVSGVTEAALMADLARQAMGVATSLREKYQILRRATRIILRIQIPAVATLLVLKLVVVLLALRS